ncbi:YrhB domain-containing protein [Duganella sp. HH105]|uniref:YrhB domain-containing protein n=1 Tax=Duganella sp. HH105 TaxID=1781067 RepID=UPI0008FFE9BA|nr:YrhB domain-containing protein [Duganella sp. HH105]
MNIDIAKEIALAHVRGLGQAVGDDFEILAESTVEASMGWIFFYNSADFVRTRNPMDSLAGNGPILVHKDGSVTELPSSIPWQDAIQSL